MIQIDQTWFHSLCKTLSQVEICYLYPWSRKVVLKFMEGDERVLQRWIWYNVYNIIDYRYSFGIFKITWVALEILHLTSIARLCREAPCFPMQQLPFLCHLVVYSLYRKITLEAQKTKYVGDLTCEFALMWTRLNEYINFKSVGKTAE